MMRPTLILALLCAPLPALAAPTATSDLAAAIAALRAGNAPQAALILHDLAGQGQADAMFNLALLYFDGTGVPQNHREALYWGWRARLSGIPAAPALLARMADAATPELRIELAARINADLDPRIAAGEGRAMLERSALLLDLLPEPDLQGAYIWQALSAALGTPNAAPAREATFARIDPKERLAAQDAAVAMLATLCAGGMAQNPICATLP